MYISLSFSKRKTKKRWLLSIVAWSEDNIFGKRDWGIFQTNRIEREREREKYRFSFIKAAAYFVQ